MDESLLELPIVPAVGLAGISLGDSVRSVRALHGEPLRADRLNKYVDVIGYGYVSIMFEHDRAVMISAGEGYEGTTLEGAYVGMPWGELKQLYPDIYYDSTYIWTPLGIDGIDFKIVLPDDDPESMTGTIDEEVKITDPENAFVQSISVRARGGRRGGWEAVHDKLAK